MKRLFLAVLLIFLLVMMVQPVSANFEGILQAEYAFNSGGVAGLFELMNRPYDDLALGARLEFNVLDYEITRTILFADLKIPTDKGLFLRFSAIWNRQLELAEPDDYVIRVRYEF